MTAQWEYSGNLAETRSGTLVLRSQYDCRPRMGRPKPRFDPLSTPAPLSTFASTAAAAKSPSSEDFQREIIDFDSESPAGLAFLAFTTATGLSRFTDIPWPKGLAPTGPAPRSGANRPLPRADVLVVTWTVDEGHALSRVLTPGKDSRNSTMNAGDQRIWRCRQDGAGLDDGAVWGHPRFPESSPGESGLIRHAILNGSLCLGLIACHS